MAGHEATYEPEGVSQSWWLEVRVGRDWYPDYFLVGILITTDTMEPNLDRRYPTLTFLHKASRG
jgi:hypothetical protein